MRFSFFRFVCNNETSTFVFEIMRNMATGYAVLSIYVFSSIIHKLSSHRSLTSLPLSGSLCFSSIFLITTDRVYLSDKKKLKNIKDLKFIKYLLQFLRILKHSVIMSTNYWSDKKRCHSNKIHLVQWHWRYYTNYLEWWNRSSKCFKLNKTCSSFDFKKLTHFVFLL